MDTIEPRRPGPRLAPIDRPVGLLQRLMVWYFRLRFGRVMSALRVVYPRIPGFTFGHMALVRFAQVGLSLEPVLRHRVELRVSARNRCGFCGDLNKAMALLEGHEEALLDTANEPLDSPLYDGRTRAALAYVDEVLRDHDVQQPTFDALRAHFDERQITELVWLTAFTNYHNMMARPLGLSSDGFCELVRPQTRAQREASPSG
jgi:AhpD family alkylhydroperoxidase